MSGMPPPNFLGGQAGGDPAAVWSEFTAVDGRKYFYNATTSETTWDKPQALKDKEGIYMNIQGVPELFLL